MMSSFTKGSWWPTGKTIKGRAELCIVTPFRFYIGAMTTQWYIEVEDGFTFDGASIPHWSRYFLPVGKIEVPAAVHDKVRKNCDIPFWLGDLVFLHAMWVYGTPRWAALLIYAMVSFNKRRD